MQKRLIRGAVLAVLLAGACGSLAFAGAGPKRDDKGDHVRVLHVTLTGSTETDLDVGAGGASVATASSSSAPVVKNGKPVGPGGYEASRCCLRPGSDPAGPPQAATDQCTGTLSLAKGQITVQGLVDRTGPIPVALAITGGTGAYRTVHGRLATSGPNEAEDEPLTLLIPHD